MILERIANAGGLDIAACAAAGLAHDIGHTPYGHVAARLLDEWVSAQDADGFEGNAQTIRAVGALDNKPGTEYGLDLTAVTLCALMKYPYTRKLGEPKFSIYDSEKDILAFARKALPDVDSFGALSNSERQSLEASVMNLADDITYATHDLEDFIVANMLKITTVLETLEAARDTLTQFEPEDIDTNHPNPLVRDALRHAARDADELSLDEYRLALRDAIQYFKRLAGPGGASADGATDDFKDYVTRIFTDMIGACVATIEVRDQPIWQGGPIIMPAPRQWLVIQALRTISEKHIIGSSLIAIQERGQLSIISDLIDRLLAWVTSVRHPAELPVELRRIYVRQGRPTQDGPKARRAVADFLCFLTDSQSDDLRRKLAGWSWPTAFADY